MPYFIGTIGNNHLTGTANDDTFTGGLGNDFLYGGAGNDVAIFSGNQSDYQFSLNPNGQITVRDFNPANGDEGLDTLSGIETIRFADGDIQNSTVVFFEEFRVNTTTTNSQNGSSLAALTNGGFVLTWISLNQDGDSFGIYAQRYDANRVAQGSEFQVNTYVANEQTMPSITALNGGGFVVTWASDGQDGDSLGVYGQRYDANGVAQGSEFRVNTFTTYGQSFPSITALTGGGFVVAWYSNFQDGSVSGVYAQRYDANGVAQGNEFKVNTFLGTFINNSSITALSNGGFVVAWNSWFRDGSDYGISAQRYDANGVAQGSEFQVIYLCNQLSN